ncbi:MerR family transcriptional regulator [Catellatospora tritici]|uniref:MerR family transcriptional regulator n=1 Tax=Catellatospora tritici TaxID=2851566 RepID=UPI0020C5387F|nr:MerR family transcriptional regulator [Catellatospora tritici]
MNDDTLYTIGALARRTGLTVKTIGFYADTGIVPSTDRSPAGYRLYDVRALARLDLVRTLRDLGLDLTAIRRVWTTRFRCPKWRRRTPTLWTCRSAPSGCAERCCARWPGGAPPHRSWTSCTDSRNSLTSSGAA